MPAHFTSFNVNSRRFSRFTLRSETTKGFTLVELLIVISIIAILSVVGIVVFTNVQKGARDARRKADVGAIAKAYEVKYNNNGSYQALIDSDFSSDSIPQDPNSSKEYFNVRDIDGQGFKVCASLEDNPNNICNTPAINCYCLSSSQGSIPDGTLPEGLTGTGSEIGLGSPSAPSCDTNGTLTWGLVDYWKMDEEYWDGTTGEVQSWTGSNNGTAYGGANTTIDSQHAGNFDRVGSFDGSDDYVIKNPLVGTP